MVELQEEAWVVVRRCRLRREAERYALVLAAMGISSRIHFDGERVLLLVANENAGAADREILTYVRENSHPAPQPLKIQPTKDALLGVGAYLCLLLFSMAPHCAMLSASTGLPWGWRRPARSRLVKFGEA